MKKYILIFIFIFFILIFSIACLQNTTPNYYNVLIYKNNEQRTGFYDTAGVPVLHGVKWKYEVNGGEPAINLLYNGILYFSRYIPFAVDAETGKEKFKPNFFSGCLYNNIVIGYEYLENKLNRSFSGWNLDTKEKIWENKYIKNIDSELIHKDILYVVTRDEGSGGDPSRYVIYLVNPMTGEILEKIEPNLDVQGIAFWRDTLVFVSSTGIYTIDFSNQINKRKIVNIYACSLYQGSSTTPVVSNNNVYFADSAGVLFSVNLKSRKVNWKIQFTEYIRHFSPAICDNVVYLSDNKAFYFIDELTGKILFTKTFAQAALSPIVTRSEVYFSTSDGFLFALDRKTGKELWNLKLAKRCMASPIISNGVIYIPVFDTLKKGYIFAIY